MVSSIDNVSPIMIGMIEAIGEIESEMRQFTLTLAWKSTGSTLASIIRIMEALLDV